MEPVAVSSFGELGAFLKAHRAQLTCAAFGLPEGRRRRTPGLRREEVAQLCGISATWYAWLEQGRDVSASPAALARIARVFHLSAAERRYLFELAGKADPEAPKAVANGALPAVITEALATIEAPAYVLDRLWNVLAWNRGAARLFRGWLGSARPPAGERNLLRYLFLEPGAREVVVGWRSRAERVVSEFRAEASPFLSDPSLAALVSSLSAESETFRALWGAHQVLDREGAARGFRGRGGKVLRFTQLTWSLTRRPEWKLVLLMPELPARVVTETAPPDAD